MKAILISIQPYWVFLIIAKTMGWNIDKEKTVEVRKNYPKSNDWNKVVKIYCSKDKKSFAKVPKEYQSFMEKFLGKVIGEFICDELTGGFWISPFSDYLQRQSCLSYDEVCDYANGKPIFAWHISNLVIYDKPRELSEFSAYTKNKCPAYLNGVCLDRTQNDVIHCENLDCPHKRITRPPQSWMYCESEVDTE